MTRTAITALELERAEMLALGRSLEPDEWRAESGCAGWSVQDVFAHLASFFHPSPIALARAARATEDAERINDALIEPRRSLSPAEQLEEYETWGNRFLRVARLLQHRSFAERQFNMGDLGSQPLHLFADAMAFDHYTHLRCDLLAPSGPIDRPVPKSDGTRLAPVAAWTVSLITPLNQENLAWLENPVRLELAGPGGLGTVIEPSSGAVTIAAETAAEPVATVRTPVTEWVRWGTGRESWKECDVRIEGDRDVAERFCSSIHVF